MDIATTTSSNVFYFRHDPGTVYLRRFVWHPEVHLQYDERCYFFFISAPDLKPDLSLVRQINEVMINAEVDSYSLYELFGTYDVLMRVWANPSTALRISSALGALATDDLLTRDVSGISYTFAQRPRPTAGAFDRRQKEIAEIVRVERGQGWPRSDDRLPEPVRAVVDDGLAIEVPQPSFSHPDAALDELPVKLYVVLERRTAVRSHAQLVSELTSFEAALRTDLLQCSTIYELGNDHGYMLKTIAPSFGSIRRALEPVYEFALTLGLRSQTFPLPPVAECRETDLVDRAIRDDSWQDERVVVRLEENAPAARVYLGALSPANRQAFVEFLKTEPSPFSHAQLLNDLINLLQGVASSDSRLMKRGLGYVIEIEDGLRGFLEKTLFETWGPEWKEAYARMRSSSPQLPALSEDFDDSDGDGFATWQFQQFRLAIGVLENKDLSFESRINNTFGPDFRRNLEMVRDVRNEVAHRFRGAIDEDGQQLSLYLLAAQIYLRLEHALEDK